MILFSYSPFAFSVIWSRKFLAPDTKLWYLSSVSFLAVTKLSASDGKYSSKVLSILDEDSVIPVISKKTKKSFFIKGGEKKLFLKHNEKPFEFEHGELVLTTSAAGYFQKGISVGKVIRTLDDVYIEPFAKVSDSIYVNILIFDFKNILE